jgi:hypothetical protein
MMTKKYDLGLLLTAAWMMGNRQSAPLEEVTDWISKRGAVTLYWLKQLTELREKEE